MNGAHEQKRRRYRPRAIAATAVGCVVLLVGGSVALATGPDQGVQNGLRGPHAARSLTQQVRDLQSQVKNLQARLSDLEDNASCEYVLPVRQWGDPHYTYGYSWIESDGSELITTGLDYVDQTDFSTSNGDEWMVAVEPSCVSTDSRVGRVHARAK